MGFPFEVMKNVLKLTIMMTAQLCEYTKNQRLHTLNGYGIRIIISTKLLPKKKKKKKKERRKR